MSELNKVAPRCWLFHKWGYWSELIVTKDGWPMQHRTCVRCHRIEVATA